MTYSPVQEEWRRGWPVILAGLLGYGSASGFFIIASSLFIAPMQAELGWSAKQLTFLPIVVFLLAVFNPVAGILTDRWGARRIVIVGLCLYSIGVVGMAITPAKPYYLYAIAAFIGITAPLSSVSPVVKGVAGWFRLSSGTAFGLTLSGVSFISLIGMPLINYAIHSFGWRSGYMVFAGLSLVIGLPAVVLGFREHPQACSAPASSHPVLGGTHWREALRSTRFWSLFLALFLTSAALGGFLGHLQPILALKDFAVAQATILGVVYAVSVLLGRLVGGFSLTGFPMESLLAHFWFCRQ
ncbi:MFS transporter [Kineobactrum salinum]|uniref:MFS transporter n=1 Tax=Kineobactrum salinum TaxID=2708301 RepID=A0A6C0U6C1_9GAMM|nr:MFS transporter [Kineobactrum salinum]QIB66899.1 MFS transporter [Kineobactrum salinum]